MTTTLDIQGTCEPRCSAVRDAFADNFTRGREVGASVSITLDGATVVDLWAGSTDEAGLRPWTHDTLVNVYSCTKGLGAICAHMLVDRGKLDLGG
jgi:CubicO group peptidase (beta-lactamase class C family)